MFNIKYFNLLTFCFMLLAQNLLSQIILQGTITDNGGEYLGNGAEPVANALVTLTDQSDASRFFSTYTNEHGQYTIQMTQLGVADDPSRTPGNFRLLQNYPNPFNLSTVIGFELSHPSQVTIDIYNILGRKVKTLLDGFQKSSDQIVWDATNAMGQSVPSGIYIYSMQTGDVRINKKMLLIGGQQGQIKALPSQTTCSVKEVLHQTVLNKSMSNIYTMQVTSADIAPYEQQNLEITSNLTVDVEVARIVTDIDGNVYQTVKIGNQWWMAENLKVTHYRNGDVIPNITDNSEWANQSEGAWCAYKNRNENVEIYGCLYNWRTVADNRNIAPQDWHIPTEEDWTELFDYLGGLSVASGKMKETGLTHWITPNEGATNESGFTALPGGDRDGGDGDFWELGAIALFWCSNSSHFTYQASYNTTSIYRETWIRQHGASLRCVKD